MAITHIIKTPNPEFYFTVEVDEDLDCEAIVSPQYRLDVGSKPYVFVVPGKIGRIAFKTKDNFKSGIISHEAVHCATTYLRLFDEDKLMLSDEIDDNEEELAYLVGWFTAELTRYYYDVIEGV